MSMMKIVVTPDMGKTAEKVAATAIAAPQIGAVQWRHAMQDLYEYSQTVVHVVSGDLKRSGKITTRVEGNDVVGELSYGGNGVDYAGEEEARGGEHAFMQRSWEAMGSKFGDALPLVFAEIVRLWR